MSVNQQVQRRGIGSEAVFTLVRMIQILFFIMAATISASLGTYPIVEVLCFVVLATGCIHVGHSFAYISADDHGVYVRRYFSTHFVRWADVTSVECSLSQGGIKVRFRSTVAGLNYAITEYPNMSIKGALAALAGKEELEIVKWIREHIESARSESCPISVLGLDGSQKRGQIS